ATAEPMMKACLAAKAHYLDITGEITVFELTQTLNAQAQESGVVLCPGVGFDVIPTDCMAAALKDAMPDATHLALGFDSRSGFSPGTAKTSVEGLAQGCKVRRNGIIDTVPLAYKVRSIDFGDGVKKAMTIPWGDVSTAYHTTGIPNIEVYLPGSPRFIKQVKRANLIRPMLGLGFVQKLIQARLAKTVIGPSEEQRASMPTYVWGEATNAKGEIKTARIRTANGYSLTITGSLAVATFLLEQSPAGGTYTPSVLMGKELVEQLPDSGQITIANPSVEGGIMSHARIQLHHSYQTLPAEFYAHVSPASASQPELLLYNQTLADELGLPLMDHSLAAFYFSGKQALPGAQPIAQAYAGH